MTNDELADLLALDALDAAEQADAELRVGTWPLPAAAATLPLAEAVVAAPPPDLREQVLAAALARRAGGRPTRSPEAIAPTVAYARVVALFHDLISGLSAQEAEQHAHEEHGRVRDLVAHLTGIETLNRRWLDPANDVPNLPDHIASTRELVAELALKPWPELVADWHRAATSLLEAARADDERRQVRFHDLVVSIGGMLTMRTFELWAHGMDIALATDRPMPVLDDAQMALMSSRLMEALPGALLYRGLAIPDRTVRFVLTGPAGGCYDIPLGEDADPTIATTTIVADVVDVCRVAAARLDPPDLDCTIDGDVDLAQLVLANIDAFARD